MSGVPQYAVGLDIGGTNLVAGVIARDDGRIISRTTVPTESRSGPEDGLQRIGDLVEGVLTAVQLTPSEVVGIGIGSTGPVDSVAGRINNPYTLPGWENLPLVDYLVGRFGVPSLLLGDAQVAALGEHWVGAGKGSRHMVYITVGTGIGGAIIVDGRLHLGVGLAAGEVGHQVIDLDGPQCYCGAQGCLEMLAAAPAITSFAVKNAPDNSRLLALAGGDRAKITPKLVSSAASQGDPFSSGLMQRVAYCLGVGVGNLINILAPEAVVLGGGVMQSWALLGPGILDTVSRRAAMVPIEQIKIVPASLGLNAGITGAAHAILNRQDGKM